MMVEFIRIGSPGHRGMRPPFPVHPSCARLPQAGCGAPGTLTM